MQKEKQKKEGRKFMRARDFLILREAMLCAIWRYVLIEKETCKIVVDFACKSEKESVSMISECLSSKYADLDLIITDIEIVQSNSYSSLDRMIEDYELAYYRNKYGKINNLQKEC